MQLVVFIPVMQIIEKGRKARPASKHLPRRKLEQCRPERRGPVATLAQKAKTLKA